MHARIDQWKRPWRVCRVRERARTQWREGGGDTHPSRNKSRKRAWWWWLGEASIALDRDVRASLPPAHERNENARLQTYTRTHIPRSCAH